jgi:ribose transport system permease protein
VKRILSIPEFGITAMFIVLAILFQAINPVFLSPGNVAGMLRAMAYTGFIAIGLSLCLISGTIDISVGAIVGLSTIVFTKSMVALEFPILISAIIAIGIGFLAGLINAIVIVRLKVSPFITTISTLYIFRGIATLLSSGYSVYPLPAGVTDFGHIQSFGMSYAFIIMVAIMVLVSILLSKTVWGVRLRATGSSFESAECTEVNPKSIQIGALIISGGLAGLAGVLVTTILGAGQPTVGTGWELIAIAGAAIGGVSLFGYAGSMYGLFMGLFTLQVINNGLITVGMPPYFQNVAIGCILLISMIVDVRRRYFMNIEQF